MTNSINVGMHSRMIDLKQGKKWKVSKENVILFLFIFSLFLDVLNNILLTKIETNFGLVGMGKAIVLFALVAYLRNKYFIFGLFFLLLIFIIRQLIITVSYDLHTFLNDLIVSSRFFLFYVSLGVLYQYRHNHLFLGKLLKLFYIFVLIQCLSIWIGYIFNIDFFRAYEWRDGYKGLLFGINDAAFFMVMALIYAYYLLITKSDLYFFVLVASATFILGLGSRGALLGILVISYIVWFYYSFNSKRINKIIFIILNIILLLIFFYLILPRISFLLEIFMGQSLRVFDGTGSILTSILSYRDQYILDYFHSINGFFSFLFGVQFPYKRDMIESDLFDFLYRFGLLGLIFFYTMLFMLVSRKNFNYFKKIFIIIIILMGSLMGHVLLSSINSIWISLFIIYYSYNSIYHRKKGIYT